jgi:hypothetical protein
LTFAWVPLPIDQSRLAHSRIRAFGKARVAGSTF